MLKRFIRNPAATAIAERYKTTAPLMMFVT
jgi:hypothetical protein